MKKLNTILSFMLLCNILHAQKHQFYIEPTLSLGTSNVTQNYIQTPLNNTSYNRSNMVNYNGGILAGYEAKRWKIETGIEYMSTGYRLKGVYFGTLFNDIRNSSVSYKYNHLYMPLQLSYAFPVWDDITVEPIIGTAVGFNLGQKETNVYKDDKESSKMSKEVFNYRYNKMVLWGNTGFRFEYRIDRKFSILAGSTFNYMLTNFIKTSQVGYYTGQHNYTILFNVGVRIRLS